MIDTLVQAQLMILWGFLDTLIRFLPIGWVWIDMIVYGCFLKTEILKKCVLVLPPGSIVSKIEISEILEIELEESGCRGSIRLEELVWTVFAQNYAISPKNTSAKN